MQPVDPNAPRPLSAPETTATEQPQSPPPPPPPPAPKGNGGWTPATRRLRAGLDADRLATADAAAGALRGGPISAPNGVKGLGSTVIADVADVNRPTLEELQRAAAALPQLKATESDLVSRLSPPEQRQYAALASALGASNEPVPQVALIQLLAEGTLQEKDSRGGTLLATLSSLATSAPLAGGVDRARLVAELTLELAQPSSIDQGPKNTCGATTVGIFLASTHPAEYGRVVAGLASPSGAVDLIKGRLTRVKDTAGDDHSYRSTPQRLLAPALMDFGNGRLLGYDNAADANTIGGLPLVPGALPSSLATMLTGLLGQDTSTEGGVLFSSGADVHRMEATVGRDVPVPTLMHYGKGSFDLHWVLATATDAKNVTIVNPWGREETMPRQEFNRRLKGFVFVNGS